MKKFLVFTQKEFYHIFRDRWTMIILLVLPILMILLFGFAITTEIKNARFAVYDPSHDLATQKITDKIQSSEYFTLEAYLSDPAEIEKIFQQGEASLVMVYSENFYENIVQTGEAQILLIADGTDPNTASTLVNLCYQAGCSLPAGTGRGQWIASLSNPYRSKIALQSNIERCLQHGSRSDGLDFDADLRHDDFCFHCA